MTICQKKMPRASALRPEGQWNMCLIPQFSRWRTQDIHTTWINAVNIECRQDFLDGFQLCFLWTNNWFSQLRGSSPSLWADLTRPSWWTTECPAGLHGYWSFTNWLLSHCTIASAFFSTTTARLEMQFYNIHTKIRPNRSLWNRFLLEYLHSTQPMFSTFQRDILNHLKIRFSQEI